MERCSIVDTLLNNSDNPHELGRQRAFELGNPYYAQFAEDGEYWRKELPTGEKFLVKFEMIFDEDSYPLEIRDTFLKPLT